MGRVTRVGSFREPEQQVLLLVVACIAIRVVGNALVTAFYGVHDELFYTTADIFADALKSGLAQRSVSAELLTAPRVLEWPLLFQGYLFDNIYLRPGWSHQWSTPLGTLQLMGVAKIIVWSSPWGALAVLFGVYLFLLGALAWLIADVTGRASSSCIWCVVLLGLSFPALFMLNRANYHSGYASIAVVTYLLTAFTGKRRWIGLIALTYAINVRPNVALITIVEFALADGFWAAFIWQSRVAVLSAAVAGISLAAANAIDPTYTFSAFLKAYAVYKDAYIFHDGGLDWNASLYGGVRSIWSVFGAVPSYNEAVAIAVTIFGVLLGFGYLWAALTRRLEPAEAVFLAVALCILFTPVLGQYHVLMLVGPVLVLCGILRKKGAEVEMTPILSAFVALSLLSLLVWLAPGGTTGILAVIGTVLVFVALQRRARYAAGISSTESLILGISILAISPLGGSLTNGVEVSILLSLASLLVIATSWRRKGGLTAIESPGQGRDRA